MKPLRWVLATLLLMALLTMLALGHALSRPARLVIGPVPQSFAASAVTIQATSGGSHVAGWFSPGKRGSGAVLLLHGVRGNRTAMLGRARFLHAQGYAVLLIDLQAHGESPGERISFGRNEAAGVHAALAFLAQQLPGERIGVIGVSLGAASLVLAEPRPAPAAVVLESMYPTIEEAVADRVALHAGEWARPLAPLLLVQSRAWLGFPASELRPIEHIGRLGSPLLLIAGEHDRHTRPQEAQALFAAATAPKDLWIVAGAAHENLHAFDAAGYEARVGAFLALHLRR